VLLIALEHRDVTLLHEERLARHDEGNLALFHREVLARALRVRYADHELLTAFETRARLRAACERAEREGYRSHELGDTMLVYARNRRSTTPDDLPSPTQIRAAH
jgi:hypothetical protein